MSAALRLSAEVQDAVIVCFVCDRGDRYLSTGTPVLSLGTLMDRIGSCKYQQLAVKKCLLG